MSIRAALAVTSIIVLAGCAPPSRDTSDDYFSSVNADSPELIAERERLARAEGGVQTDIIDTTTPASSVDGNPSTEDLIRQDQQTQATPAPVPATPEDRTTISNSQDFEVVTGRVTADSDAAKLDELKRTYRVFEPTAVPTSGGSVDLEAYAKSNSDRAVGRKRFTRKRSDYKTAGNSFCQEYPDQNLAQINFLNQGGPRKDPLLLDQDGDGFACSWQPNQYLRAIELRNRRVEAATPLN